jgi:hypothetical protein
MNKIIYTALTLAEAQKQEQFKGTPNNIFIITMKI